MNTGFRIASAAGLYLAALAIFLFSQLSIVSGCPWHLSYPNRVALCCLAILLALVAPLTWRAKHRWAKLLKVLLTVSLILFIAALGFENNAMAALAGGIADVTLPIV